MGNLATTLFCTSVSAPDQKTRQYLEKICEKAVKVGGNNNFTSGGYDSLADYGNSMFSQAKEKLIRGIAKDVAGILKISPGFAEKADLKDVIEKFTKVVPDPRKGRKIKADSKIHIDVCKQLADAINKNYKLDLVNKDASAEQICQVVSELLYSLFTGFHSEFFTVASDVSRIVKNLTVMQEYLDGINKKLIKDLGDCNEGDDTTFKDTYTALTREINRQHAYLTNLVSGVIGPAGESLINLVEENKELTGLTSDLRDAAGTREFSDKLSTMMSGISSVAHAAYLVDKALKTIGMSVGEYKNTKDMKELRTKIYDHMVKNKPNSKELNKYMVAADILYRNDLAHDDIAAHLSKKGGEFIPIEGGEFIPIEGGCGNDTDDDVTGGDEGMGFAQMVSDGMYKDLDSVYQGRRQSQKKSISSQLNKRERFREKLFQDLNHQIQYSYNEIILDLYKIGKKIGSEIPVTDKLHTFIRQLSYFSAVQPDRKNLHKALSGWRQDVKSEYVKHDFIRALETVASSSSDLASGSTGSYFKNVSAAINKLIKLISDFNDTFTKALTEVHVDAPEATKGGDSESSIASLAGMEGIVGGMNESDFKYLVTMQKAIREIEYYFKISNIKANLKVSAAQSENYTKNYENILGEECGMLIDRINQQARYLTCNEKNMDDVKSVAGVINVQGCEPRRMIDLYKTANPAAHEQIENKWRGYVFLIEYIRSAKVEMIEAAQALDLYLSKFAESIQSNPNDIKEFVKMLEQIEIVAKWFTDKSGDNLVNVFESFSWDVGANNNMANTRAPLFNEDGSSEGKTLDISEHYYARLDDGNGGPALCNNSNNIISELQVKTFIIRIEKTFKSMRALENIISTFSKLSNKSSGDDIKTFMSPGMIFKSFMKYAVATSISVGFDDSSNSSIANYMTFVQNKLTLFNTTPVNVDHINNVFSFGIQNVKNFANVEVGRGTLPTSYLCKYDPLEFKDTSDIGYLSTDDIFEMSIKSLISKVFVVVGAYSLFQRPAKDFDSNLSLSNRALRQIMGGNASVKIIPEATELYIRLPLLAEWYREIFKFKTNSGGSNNILVSMIPNFDGIWAKFVKVIFVDADGVNDGGYTASFTEQIISSINDIYTHYKSKYGANMCAKVLENFVSEVNLRYGLIKQSEINKYITERNAGLSNSDEYENDDNVDYDILDSKDQFGRKPAPSDKFRKVGVNNYLGKGNITTSKIFKTEVEKFRGAVESALNLNSFQDQNFGQLNHQYASVDDLVKQTINRIHESKSDSEKYNIVQTVIIGAERFSEFDYDEMLLFHETVINPLTILYVIYKILNEYNKFANSLDVGEDAKVITDALNITGGMPVTHVHLIAHLTNKMKTGVTPYLNNPDCYFQTLDDYSLYMNDTGATAHGVGGGAWDYEISSGHMSIKWGDIGNIGVQRYDVNSDKYNELYTRYIMRKRNLMRDCINHMYYLTCDKNPLVELTYSGDGENRFPMLKFNKMEKVTTELYECIKESLTKFRKILPHTEIAKYEKLDNKEYKTGNTNIPNINSLFYIKEHLFDRLFANKYGGGLSDANNSFKNIWLYLTKKWSFTNLTLPAGGAPFQLTDFINGADDERYDTYDSVISQLTYWYAHKTININGSNLVITNYDKFPLNKTGVSNETSLGHVKGTGLSDKIISKIEGSNIKDSFVWSESKIEPLPVAGQRLRRGVVYIPSQSLFERLLNIRVAFNPYMPNNSMLTLLKLTTYPNMLIELYNVLNIMSQYDGIRKLPIYSQFDSVYNIALKMYEISSNQTPNANVYNAGNKVPSEIISEYFNESIMKLSKFPDNFLSEQEQSSLNPMIRITDFNNLSSMSAGSVGTYKYNDKNTEKSLEYTSDNTELGGSGNYGLVFSLNNLLYKCSEMFTDAASKKIYLPLFEQFANGLNAGEIMSGKAIDDVTIYKSVGVIYPSFQYLEIEKNQAIFATVAQAIKSIVTSKLMTTSALSVLKHAERDLTNVSEYMKDLMTAYLPIFEKELHILSCKADLIKGVLENTKIRVYRHTDENTNDVNNVVTRTYSGATQATSADAELQKVVDSKIAQKLKVANPMLNNERKGFLISLLSHISASSKSFESCIRNTYKELNDVPLYFETYKNSISDYQNRNNIMPLMPLSHVSYLLNTTNFITNDVIPTMYKTARGGLLPHINTGVGSDEFKFAYGTRGLLSYNEPSIDLAPGVTSILNIYNAKVGGAASYDKRKMNDTFNNCTLLLRYATDYIYHKTVMGDNNITKCSNFTRTIKLVTKPNDAVAAPINMNIVGNLACQTGMHMLFKPTAPADINTDLRLGNDPFFTSQTNIKLLIDNDNYKQSVYRLLTCITKSINETAKITNLGRKELRIYNILDCNIVPINFHALQSEIPLVNLMNYSYTFDHMVKQFIGVECKNDSLSNILVPFVDPAIDGAERNQKIAKSKIIMRKYSHPEDTLVRMLIAPRGSRRTNEFNTMVWRIMAGNTSLNLNKPKYLSDQLWNKVLLQSLYTPENNVDQTNWTPGPNNYDLQSNDARLMGRDKNRMYKYNLQEFEDLGFDTNANNSFLTDATIDTHTYIIKDKGAPPHQMGFKVKPAYTASAVKTVKWNKEGYTRYQTKIVRYIEWFIHLQRVMRLLMRDQLQWVNDPIVHQSNALAEEITEFKGNNTFEVKDFE